jgi:hypothetical protein
MGATLSVVTLTPHPEAPKPFPPICKECNSNEHVVLKNIIKSFSARASWWCNACQIAVCEPRE